MTTSMNVKALLFLASFSLWVPCTSTIAAGPPTGLDVNVINPASRPVPVTGSIAVTGTSNVNVTNASIPVTGSVNVTNASIPVTGAVSAAQAGTWNVGLVGTPTVIVVDPSTQMPYSNHSTCGTESNPCAVPAGKRLVIEYVSGVFTSSANPTNNTVMIVNGAAEHDFVGYAITGSVPGLFAFSTPMKMVLDSGASFYWVFGDRITVTGYLIN